jgi:chloride channel 3/4/5
LKNIYLVEFILGLVAGFVDIGAKWMSHWRSGICKPAFWLNREQCCWGSRDVQYDDVHNELCQHVRDN